MAVASLLLNFGIVDLIDGLTGVFTDDTTWVRHRSRALRDQRRPSLPSAVGCNRLATAQSAAATAIAALVWAAVLPLTQGRRGGPNNFFGIDQNISPS